MSHYDTMGLKRGATSDEIKKAFRSLAQKHHPDHGGNEAMFKKVTEAYAVLGNEAKRKEYDGDPRIYGPHGATGSPGPNINYNTMSQSDIDSILNDFLRNFNKSNSEQMRDILRESQRVARATSEAQGRQRTTRDDVARAFRDKMGPGFFTTS